MTANAKGAGNEHLAASALSLLLDPVGLDKALSAHLLLVLVLEIGESRGVADQAHSHLSLRTAMALAASWTLSLIPGQAGQAGQAGTLDSLLIDEGRVLAFEIDQMNVAMQAPLTLWNAAQGQVQRKTRNRLRCGNGRTGCLSQL